MACFTKTLIRFGVISGLLAGGAVVIAGPHRVAALGQQFRSKVVTVIDRNIEDPVAMRAQLRDLETRYPKRIAEVRSHLAELREQMSQLDRDKAISARVVEMARADYDELKSLIVRAEDAQAEYAGARFVTIAFRDTQFGVEDAYSRANAIADTVNVYTTRANDLNRDLGSLQRDASRLESLLAKLESEHAQFRAQIAQLDGQIDAIARKERMVALMSERQKRIDELSRYQVASLDQFKSTVARRHAELDSALETLSANEGATDYVDRARFEVDTKTTVIKPKAELPRIAPTSIVIESEKDMDEKLPASVARRNAPSLN